MISLAKLNASFPYPEPELFLSRMPDAQAAPGCRVAMLPLSQGTICSGAVSHWFYTTGESSHPVRGLQPSFPACTLSHGLVNDFLLLLNLEGSSCPQVSERSFVCLAVKSCPYHPLSRCKAFSSSCTISLPERPMKFFPSFMDPLHCLFLISLDSIFLYFHVEVSKHP